MSGKVSLTNVKCDSCGVNMPIYVGPSEEKLCTDCGNPEPNLREAAVDSREYRPEDGAPGDIGSNEHAGKIYGRVKHNPSHRL